MYKENQKLLQLITFQNYFRMYKKLSGMTGTAKTEEEEFKSIYKMDVVVVPTNKPVQREDLPDVVYKMKMENLMQLQRIYLKDIKNNNQY